MSTKFKLRLCFTPHYSKYDFEIVRNLLADHKCSFFSPEQISWRPANENYLNRLCVGESSLPGKDYWELTFQPEDRRGGKDSYEYAQLEAIQLSGKIIVYSDFPESPESKNYCQKIDELNKVIDKFIFGEPDAAVELALQFVKDFAVLNDQREAHIAKSLSERLPEIYEARKPSNRGVLVTLGPHHETIQARLREYPNLEIDYVWSVGQIPFLSHADHLIRKGQQQTVSRLMIARGLLQYMVEKGLFKEMPRSDERLEVTHAVVSNLSMSDFLSISRSVKEQGAHKFWQITKDTLSVNEIYIPRFNA